MLRMTIALLDFVEELRAAAAELTELKKQIAQVRGQVAKGGNTRLECDSDIIRAKVKEEQRQSQNEHDLRTM